MTMDNNQVMKWCREGVVSILSHTQDVEDATMEAVIKVLTHNKEIHASHKFCYRVGKNAAIDLARKQYRRVVHSLNTERPSALAHQCPDEATYLDSLPDHNWRKPFDEMDAIRDLDAVPARSREAIMFSVMGVTPAEVAEIKGISIPAAKTRLYRAREKNRSAA